MRSLGVVALLAPLALAGCLGPSSGPQPAVATSPGNLLLPPSLLLDRAQNGTLQVFVHAAQGNVRYEHLNLSVLLGSANGTASVPSTLGANVTVARERVYALDEVLPGRHANLTAEAVQGTWHFAWRGDARLNESGEQPSLVVSVLDAKGGWSAPRNFTLPYQTLLAPVEEARP